MYHKRRRSGVTEIKGRKSVLRVLFIFLAVTGILALYTNREFILRRTGQFLVSADTGLEKSDVIVILRDDKKYTRVLDAWEIFKKGYANRVFISTALTDGYITEMKKTGVILPSAQENIYSILVQLGVPENRILLDVQPPGGGTKGELCRIRNMMKARRYKSCIIVTDWYHTRRTRLLCDKIFSDSGIKFQISTGPHGLSSPDNWWKYRYEAVDALEEFPKLALFYLSDILRLKFKDDPEIKK